jgi:hypothetical protein
MPRHLRNAAEVPQSVTIQVGVTMSDARKQMALRTFASQNGDLVRTAKLLGVDAEEVKNDLLSFINGGPSSSDEDGGSSDNGAAAKNGAAKKPAPAKKR